jgi:hypothetical protein
VKAHAPLDLNHNEPPVVLVPTKGWDRITGKALRFAMWLSRDVIAVHLSNLSGEEARDAQDHMQNDWEELVETPARRHGVPVPKLVMVPCPYRRFIAPMMAQIDCVKRENPGRLVAVVIPDLVETRWWHLFLHRRKPARLRSALLKRGDHGVVVVDVPWYVDA